MSLATADLFTDPDPLRGFALACQAEFAAAMQAVQLSRLEIEKLKMRLARLRRMQFGRSSERLDLAIEQLELKLEELEADEAESEAAGELPGTLRNRPDRMQPKRRPLPDHLPRVEFVHHPDGNEVCLYRACGSRMSRLGKDVTEVPTSARPLQGDPVCPAEVRLAPPAM